jgi:hypothetical protein
VALRVSLADAIEAIEEAHVVTSLFEPVAPVTIPLNVPTMESLSAMTLASSAVVYSQNFPP